MKFNIHVDGVDGETYAGMMCAYAGTALEFLQDNDHEGSSIGLEIEVDNAEEVYAVLKHLDSNAEPT